jgi:hypothetical protein
MIHLNLCVFSGIDFGSAPSSSSALDDGALYSDLDASTLRQLRIDEAQAVALAESDDLDVALNCTQYQENSQCVFFLRR